MSEWPTYPEPGGLVPAPVPQPPVVQTSPEPEPPAWLQHYSSLGQTPQTPVVYTAGGETFRKSGEWTVAPFIRIKGGFGTVILDMQRARAAAPIIHLEVAGGLGEIRIIVPEGWGADISAVTPGLGSRKCDVDEQPAPGFPLLYATGSLMLGSFTIRYPTAGDLRRLAKEIRRDQGRQSRALR